MDRHRLLDVRGDLGHRSCSWCAEREVQQRVVSGLQKVYCNQDEPTGPILLYLSESQARRLDADRRQLSLATPSMRDPKSP